MHAYPPLNLRPIHPGEILAEDVLPFLKTERGVTKAEFARRLHMSRVALDNILKGKSSITPPTAHRLARLVGSTPEHWLGLQADYDLTMTKAQLADELAGMESLTAV